MQNTNPALPSSVTVIGLGAMGATLARLLLKQGVAVTVWNRTAAKAEALVSEGATFTPEIVAAVTASPVIVICVHDYSATDKILGQPEAAEALRGRVIVQLTTGSPQESRAAEKWAQSLGARFLAGAIQAAPSQMGRDDTTLLLSGPQADFDQAAPVLRIFGRNLTYLGDDAGAAATMDLATLSYVYGTTLGFFQGALVIEKEGLSVDHYARIVAAVAPGFGEFLRHEGAVIHSGDFAITESPLSISVEATERIAQAARDAGIHTELPNLAAKLFRQAHEAGYSNEEAAALIKILRRG